MHISSALTTALSLLGCGLLASAAPEDLSKRQTSGRTTSLLGGKLSSILYPSEERSRPPPAVFPGQGFLPTLASILALNTSGTFLSFDNIQADVLSVIHIGGLRMR